MGDSNHHQRDTHGMIINDEIKKSAKAILKKDIIRLQLIPPVAIKLLQQTNDERSSFTNLTKIIETDAALSIEVLRLVNSAFYNFSQTITSIKRAVTALGFSTIRQIALNVLFFKRLIKPDLKQAFDQLLFWQHCLFVAILSRLIAKQVGHFDPDQIYAAGLLHDIGKIILEDYGKLTYSDFRRTFKKSDNDPLLNERSFFGLDHTQLGAVFCQRNDIPESIVHSILYHHSNNLHSIPESCHQEVAIVAFANFIAELQGIGCDYPNHTPLLDASFLDYINNQSIDLEACLKQADSEVRELSHFFKFEFPDINTLRVNLLESCFISLQSNKTAYGKQRIKRALPKSLTVPHHSLDENEFIPWTLEALHNEFHYDRLLFLDINSERQLIQAKYWWPENVLQHINNHFTIPISALSKHLVDCLREKRSLLVDKTLKEDQKLLDELDVDAFFSLPVLTHNRFSGILYIDNFYSRNQLKKSQLSNLQMVANELGIAMVNARRFEQEKKKAQLDSLTRLNNKGMIERFLSRAFQEQQFKLEHMAIGFIDIDHFKNFNDRYGHQAGDDVLKIVADILKSLTRPSDFIGRYGGEEFLFVLLNGDRKAVNGFSERIRSEIEQQGHILKERFPEQHLTVSIGVAMYHPAFTSYQKMIEKADEAMYQAKEEGRNRVVVLT
jgi:diguanylate cyclase (GGDEF)-like protein/putative nucleotidyltransferase with HDIG domain